MPSGLHCSYRWGIDDGNGLDNFLLVRLGARTVEIADNRGHTSLVAHGSGQVDWLLRVVLGEAAAKILLSERQFLIFVDLRIIWMIANLTIKTNDIKTGFFSRRVYALTT